MRGPGQSLHKPDECYVMRLNEFRDICLLDDVR